MSSWRDRARPIIAEVISCCGPKCDLAFVRKAISATYSVYDPTETRDYWPYRVWLDEVRRQLGRAVTYAERMTNDDPRQMSL